MLNTIDTQTTRTQHVRQSNKKRKPKFVHKENEPILHPFLFMEEKSPNLMEKAKKKKG